ncbi:unnamed protein product [Ectocarpus sp. CCAP 1310/34]|nr:unnamed protein product [Ectocarpus sp. CCAP 1310/34]
MMWRASVPRGPGARASKPLGRVHLDLCGPLVPSLGGNLYLFVAVDSASRWNKVYGLRRKSDALAATERLLADVGRQQLAAKIATERLLADVGRYDLGRIECFRVDNGTEWTCGDFRRFCDDNGIGVEFTPPGVPHAGRVFNVDFASIPGLDERGDRLWMESAKWAADALNQSATKANPGRRSPHEMFTGEQGPFRVLPFFQPGFMREDRRTKVDDQATLCYYLNGGDNHPSGSVKNPAMPPLPAHAMRQLRPGTKAESMTDPWLPSRTRPGTRHSTGLISMLDKNALVSMLEVRSAGDEERRELGGAEAGEPGGTGTGEQAGALAAVDPGAAGAGFPLAFATLLANREDIDATLRDQRPPEQRPDLPHCQASDLRVPKSYKEAMASEHRHLWSDSMQREFYGLLEAGTFTPAKERCDKFRADLNKSVPVKNLGELRWPDIANAVRAVARYCASPKLVHWTAAMDILGYARRTSHFGISFQRGTVEGFSLQGYADADFASKAADRRSVSGGIVTCGGGAVSWFSRTQKCVTLSTTEAEYVALGDVVKEILFLRQIWRFMLPQVGMPCIPVFEDNQGAIQLAQNPISNSNSKHIDVRHHFLWELAERKEISVIHVPSPYQRADFLTKSLSKDAFESHRDFVMNLA